MSAPGCRFQHLAVCFQEVPRAEATGYSRSNRQQPILPSTATLSIGSRRRNLQQPCSTRAGVTCHPLADAVGSVVLGMAAPMRNWALPQTARSSRKAGCCLTAWPWETHLSAASKPRQFEHAVKILQGEPTASSAYWLTGRMLFNASNLGKERFVECAIPVPMNFGSRRKFLTIDVN